MLIEGGYVVTNAHLVSPYDRIDVAFENGDRYRDVAVKGVDIAADLAVVGPIARSSAARPSEATSTPSTGATSMRSTSRRAIGLTSRRTGVGGVTVLVVSADGVDQQAEDTPGIVGHEATLTFEAEETSTYFVYLIPHQTSTAYLLSVE